MPILVNPYRFGAGGGGSTVNSFVGSTESTLDASTYTFTNHAIGVADASRIVVVGIIVQDSGSNYISSVTIGGSAATEAANTTSSSNLGDQMRIAAIYYRAVAAGTTATIVVNLGDGVATGSCGIAVWSLYPTSSTPVDTHSQSQSGVATLTNAAFSVESGGFMVAVSGHANASANLWEWSGTGGTVTEEVDEALGDSGLSWTVLSMPTSATETSRIRVTWTSSVNGSLAAASWGP